MDAFEPSARTAASMRSSVMGVLVFVIPVLAAVLIFSATASHEGAVGPLRVRASLRPAIDGITELALLPFGTVGADTHAGPVDVTLALVSVDLDGLTAVAKAGQPDAGLVEQWLALLRTVVVAAAARGLVAGLTAAAVVAWALTRSVRRVGLSIAASLAILVVPVIVAGATFDQQAFAEPRFDGVLTYAPATFSLVEERLADIGGLQRQIGSLAGDLAAYYGAPQSLMSGGSLPGTYRVLHVSDLHLDPVGMQLVIDLAAAYDAEVIIDTGDITHFGTAQEAELAVAQLGSRPHIFVPGNHDSPAISEAIGADTHVTVIDNETTTTARGLRVLGVGDPAGSGSDVEPDSALAAERGRAVAAERAGQRWDIVAVHDPASGEPFAGRATAVLSGHTHTASLEVRDGTVFLGAGTTGGVHFTELRPDPHIPHGAAVLYFSLAEPGRLVAIDQIEVYGKNRQSSIRRTIIDEEFVRGE